jgi:hypothetical protein
MKSWKSTVFGIGAILTATGSILQALFDGNPNTNPDFAPLIAALSAGLGLLFTRDNDVTSEDAGAK